MRPALLFVFASAAFAVAAPVPKALKKANDAQLLEGRWVSVSIDCGRGPEADKNYWLSVKDGKLLWSHLSSPIRPDTPPDSPFELDETTSPKQLDELRGETDPTRHTYVYALDGDTLTLGFSAFSRPRPTELKGDRKAGVSCIVFRRADAEKK